MNEKYKILLQASGWDESVSDIEGYFPSKPAGGKCLWSASWLCYGFTITPDEMRPLDGLSDKELMLELVDIESLHRARNPELSARAKDVLHRATQGGNLRGDAFGICRDSRDLARERIPEFVHPVIPPSLRGYGALMNLQPSAIRPGWGDKQSILARAAEMPQITTPR